MIRHRHATHDMPVPLCVGMLEVLTERIRVLTFSEEELRALCRNG